MRILKASLTYRFYVHDGWTRQAVSELFDNLSIEFVLPRYYDMEQDDKIMCEKERFALPASFNDSLFEDCEYFAVYHPDYQPNTDKLNQHQIDSVF